MVVNFTIEFEKNPNAIFYAGQVVRGIVTLDLDKPKDVRGVRLEIKGFADTDWSQNEFGKTVHYGGHEDFVSEIVELVKPEKSSKCILQPGAHRYEFTFQLPESCPPSLNTSSAKIQYFVKIILDRPWKFNQTFTKEFIVFNNLDLNEESSLVREPVIATLNKTFGLPFQQSEPLQLEVNIHQSGFIPGESIPIILTIHNESDVPVEEIKTSLYMKTIAHDSFSKIETETDFALISKMKGEGVMVHCKKIFNYTFEVPVTPATCLHLCRIIEMSYELRIQAKVKGLHLSPVLAIPITIGNEPLKETPEKATTYEKKELKVTQDDSQTTAPQDNKLPPSYEDANSEPSSSKITEK